ncbi:MAG: hypothetical protein COU85_02270, partial [Candidatus Portnoybacteria bacterium CG10_big_fil_rev_8_21_14_0_10_44_7]
MKKFKKISLYIFFGLMALSLLTPFWAFRDLLFPYITSKAFFFRIAVELAFPFYLFLAFIDKNLRPKLKNPLNLTVLVFLAINIITAFTGVNFFRSIWGNFERMGGVYYLLHLVLFYFYIQLLGQAGSWYLKRFLQSFIAVASLVALNGIVGWLGGPVLVLDPSLPVRVSSTFGNPIFFASYLMLPLFLAAYFAVQEASLGKRIVYGIAAMVQMVGVYSSGTRGAAVGLLVGLFLGLIIYIALTKKPKLRRWSLSAIAILVIAAGLLYSNYDKLAPGSTLSRLVNLRDRNTEARLIQWKIAYEGFKDSPLVGVGPENYYVIFDSHYEPALYEYDASWFDKPHNFILEVLVTNGIFGFLVYFAMFGLAFFAFWRAFKFELLGLLEMCLLAAGLIAYQVQNLFVFDTVSAGVAFYAFMGLAAYMWVESKVGEGETEVSFVKATSPVFPLSIFAVFAAVALYLVYITNIASLEASKRINFGFAYTDHDPKVAAQYFEDAFKLPFNIDLRESVGRYSDFANALAVNGPSQGLEEQFVRSQLETATGKLREIAEQVKNDPLLWSRLATNEMNMALLFTQDFSQASTTIEQTISLAPKRTELLQLRLQLYGNNQNWSSALETAREITNLNSYNSRLQWQLAMVEYLSGNMEAAVAEGDRGVEMGYNFNSLQEFAWYIQYYQEKQDYPRVAKLLERAIELEPKETGLYAELALTYAEIGDVEKAILLAKQVSASDPSFSAQM